MNRNRISQAAAESTKFKIEQNVPSGSVKKGPYAVERSVDPNEVVIKRRFGEGSKPLFQRDDIAVNDLAEESYSNTKASAGSGFLSGNSKTAGASHWRDASRPESNRQHSSHHHTGSSHHPRSSSNNRNSSSYAVKRGTATGAREQREQEKVPYFRDEVRERDRLRRIYGSANGSSSTKHPRRSRSKSRSRSFSPPASDVRSRTRRSPSLPTTRRHRSSARTRSDRSPSTHAKRRSRGSRGRSLSAESGRHKERHRSHQRAQGTSRRRSSRSLSRSRTRSRERERERDHRTHERERAEQAPLTPQIITIPVPVPAEYAYGYPTWAAHPQWGAPTGLPPPRFAPYGMLQAQLMPPLRPPPPYGVPQYGGRMFRPQLQRYSFNRRNYRPRNA